MEMSLETRSIACELFFDEWRLVVQLHKEVVGVNVPVAVVVKGCCVAVWVDGVAVGSEQQEQVHDEGGPHDITYEGSRKKVPYTA